MTGLQAKRGVVILALLVVAGAASGCSPRATCSDFERDVCESALRCAPRVAVELDDRGAARERFAGCDTAARVCDAALTCGRRGETEEVALFEDTCLPAGWSEAPAEECASILAAVGGASGPLPSDAGAAVDGQVPPA